ncbi:MAG: ferric uptake regulator family protein [Desulfatitalea sp. BRH_c12]|nr:MAG: ferric uptake regulator family protein [Desulfatitalea sp. BRH_c12]
MCQQCNYTELLARAGLEATGHRLRVLEVIGDNTCPLSAQEIFDTVRRSRPINRVTVYRVLEMLVQGGLVDRLSSGGRAFFYGLAPNRLHAPHPHFFCRRCGRMDCLRPDSIALDLKKLQRVFPGQIENVEVRVDGICRKCLQK